MLTFSHSKARPMALDCATACTYSHPHSQSPTLHMHVCTYILYISSLSLPTMTLSLLISSSPLLLSSHICTCNPSPPLFTFPSPYPSSLQRQPSPLLPFPCLTMLPSVAWKTRSVKVAVSQMCPTQEGSMMGRPALTAICNKEHVPLPDQSLLYLLTVHVLATLGAHVRKWQQQSKATDTRHVLCMYNLVRM